jgi:hypothetical protein
MCCGTHSIIKTYYKNTQGICGFPQTLKANAGTIPQLSHDNLLNSLLTNDQRYIILATDIAVNNTRNIVFQFVNNIIPVKVWSLDASSDDIDIFYMSPSVTRDQKDIALTVCHYPGTFCVTSNRNSIREFQ